MTLEINLSLGQGWVKNFKSERNKLKACHCGYVPGMTKESIWIIRRGIRWRTTMVLIYIMKWFVSIDMATFQVKLG